MTYKLTTGWPQHIESGEFVNPETNSGYLAYLASGQTPEPADTPPAKTKEERIKDELRKLGATEVWQIEGAAAGMLALFIAQGKTEEQAYAESPLYHSAKDVMNKVYAIMVET